jgi:hypothetical protein
VSGLEGVSALALGDSHSCAVVDGGVWCWGANFYEQLANGTEHSPLPLPAEGMGEGVTAVAAGGAHTCAIKEGGLWCWGYNRHGQIGTGHFGDGWNWHAPIPPTLVPGMEVGGDGSQCRKLPHLRRAPRRSLVLG